ncbi:DUF2868 domain-containing protein [Exilibacterium tricleocarpae]|uniref:DUF2868 domain-containing protein n=1 Tax=Exilibacterium tricleocarpae TaxID=2591008 RepID=A0A545U9D4_9GAMM|nr:DUF2868 domain-containing protein [Exilibacterium tricleocarpae]TQV86049.1 DUF2868 domain-containing protein [Exilibacterium tricleocarpae]
MQLSFKDKLLVEQVRYMEEAGALAVEPDAVAEPGADALPSLLVARARRVVQQQGLGSRVAHAPQWCRRFTLVLVIFAAFAGALAVQQALGASAGTLNIYWLLLVLLGFNFLSLVLWLAGAILMGTSLPGASAPANGLLSGAWHWLESRITGSDRLRAAADRGWWLACLRGAAGRWWFAGLSHGLWMIYLAVGFAVLLLLLMTRQYDFIWATTILADDVFITVTGWLAAPLAGLGFSVPDLELVQSSQHGNRPLAPEAARRAWAFFLLGGLLVYGVLPRLVLLGFSRLMLALARRRYQLDLTLPYYIKLHRALIPESRAWQVVDPDSAAGSGAAPVRRPPAHRTPPLAACWVGVELAAATRWPPPGVSARDDLGQVTGSTTLAAALARLEGQSDQPLVAAVSLARPADRGLRRTLDNLYTNRPAAQRWLALLRPAGAGDISTERLNGWMSLAQTCGVPADQLIVMDDIVTDGAVADSRGV